MFSNTTKLTMLWLMLLTAAAWGTSLTGVITDKQTGEPVPGAVVKLAGCNIAAAANSSGSFTIGELPFGASSLSVSHIGYKIAIIRLDNSRRSPLKIELEPKILKGQDIIVTATRAKKGQTPAAFSNMNNKEIKQNYWAQDTPMLLASMPNIFAYSDAGSGIGYSYMKIRGFGQNRISVMLNGIPLNDAESHEVFWVDLPDFANNVQDIQVQRGVGNSMYGASAIGGSVNLTTTELSAVPLLKAETGYGSFNTKKMSVSGSSGLINDRYMFYGRYSKIETDGYRDNSWTDMYAYFFSIARFDERMTWKFNTYGGPEESHLAYKGITSEQLTGNRKYNELEYKGEIDHFSQPHYEFFWDWNVNDNIDVSNTFYYFNGNGYYSQKRSRKDVEEYFPGIYSIKVSDTTLAPRDYYDTDDLDYFIKDEDSLYTIEKVDLIRRPEVNEHDWGWLPRIAIKHNKGILAFGGEMRIHAGHHFSEVSWASVYPQGFAPDARYYDYRGKSNTYTVYAHESYNLLDRLTAMINIQYQRHKYMLEDDKRFNAAFNRSYDFFSPRVGISYNASARVNIFLNTSMASRHPAFKDIYDPTDYWSNPNYKADNFTASGSSWIYNGKELNPEKMYDIEVGADLKHAAEHFTFKSGVNLYRMQIKDEIVPYSGQLDDMNYPISGNAEKTIHQGVELSFDTQIRNEFVINGNISVNDYHFVSYKEYGFDWDNWEPIEYNRADKKIGGFPSILANYRLAYIINDLMFGINGKYVGKQYIDNGEDYKLNSYHIQNFDIAYDFGRLIGINSFKASFRVNNVSDTEYEQAAYIEEDDGKPRYMVGADRNFYFSISTEF
ncbi:MAG: TonB-dependent receptor [candidate division Zixibacteria bacterium]|nr:TonB-dependent receptor [candidate division Zixibacteria bacterium]